MKTYEIHNLTTGEILADNITFDEIPELFEAYSSFYVDCEIIACYRDTHIKRCNKFLDINTITRNAFYSEWLNLIDELYSLGNIY